MDIQRIILSVLPLLVAITFHEASHGFVANKLGDPTARLTGRLTLNPIAHIDPVGTILMPLILIAVGAVPFGYAKPVPINPMNFKDPKRDMAISAAAGPVTNLALAVICQVILSWVIIPLSPALPKDFSMTVLTPLGLMLEQSVWINVILAVFNMLPIPPLDGGRVLVGLLPYKQAVSYSKIEPYGIIIVLVLVMTGLARYFIVPFAILFLALIKLI